MGIERHQRLYQGIVDNHGNQHQGPGQHPLQPKLPKTYRLPSSQDPKHVYVTHSKPVLIYAIGTTTPCLIHPMGYFNLINFKRARFQTVKIIITVKDYYKGKTQFALLMTRK